MHEVAQAAARDSRVAYVEVDPVAIAHSKVMLAGDDQTEIIDADLREPGKILTTWWAWPRKPRRHRPEPPPPFPRAGDARQRSRA